MRDAACRDAGSQANLEFEIQDPESLAASQVFVPSHRWPGMAVDFSLPEQAAKAAHFWNKKTGPPQAGSIHELVAKYGGRFFEGPRCWQQEPHWPFAWAQAKHNWILRLDADEFPSPELKHWLETFRSSPEPSNKLAGYTCTWPPWNGRRATSMKWPAGRIFLFDRRRLQFFGMAEQVPVSETIFSEQDLILKHQPVRKSYGVRNVILRQQAYRWRQVIALSLLKTPTDLPRWRCADHAWPLPWSQIRSDPLKYATRALVLMPLFTAKTMLKSRNWPRPGIVFQSAVNHFMLAMLFWSLRRRSNNK
jgi:hypothetical protein